VLKRFYDGVLDQVLRQVKVAEQTDEARDELRGLLAKHAGERVVSEPHRCHCW
jgi:hypothetical protein